MECREFTVRLRRSVQICDLVLQLLWYFMHLLVHLWYLYVGSIQAIESDLISSGLLRRYKNLDVSKLRYLAIVIESEDAYQIPQVLQLLKWLAAIGVKHVCLYDSEGFLKKCKKTIIKNFENARLFEDTVEKDVPLDQKHMTLEFASISDGKEAIAKAANQLFVKYLKLADACVEQEDEVFTEACMDEALRDLVTGYSGPEPDLLLIYGPVRCHLGFPAWRIRYTEMVHMGPLKSMRYGFLIKAIYKFTMVHQNYGS